eukprot:37585-Karenia_brevis.AAC.1
MHERYARHHSLRIFRFRARIRRFKPATGSVKTAILLHLHLHLHRNNPRHGGGSRHGGGARAL